jgi:hypothetical protein
MQKSIYFLFRKFWEKKFLRKKKIFLKIDFQKSQKCHIVHIAQKFSSKYMHFLTHFRYSGRIRVGVKNFFFQKCIKCKIKN